MQKYIQFFKNHTRMVVVSIVLVLSSIRLYLAMQLPIHPDEAYWWMFSRILDWSYYDHGPGVAIFIKSFTYLLGDHLFAIRVASLVSSVFLVALVYKLARELGFSIKYASIAALTYFLLPGIFLGSFLTLHDSVFIPLWVAALYAGVRFLQRKENAILILFFVFLGLGALAKNSMFLFVPAVVIWLLFTPSEYGILKNNYFWLGVLIAFMILFPFLYWNYRFDWAGLEMPLHMRYSGTSSRDNKGIFTIIGAQLLSFTPFLFAFVLLSPLYQWRKFAQFIKTPIWGFIASNAFVMPLFFLVISNSAAVQANWIYPSYAAMILFGFGFIESQKKEWQTLHHWVYLFLVPVILTVFLYFLIFSKLLSYPAFLKRGIPNLNQGYDQMIAEIEGARKEIDNKAILIANNYQDAARASWYLEGHRFVSSLNLLKKNQYSYWPRPVPGKNYFIFSTTDKECRPVEFLDMFLPFICHDFIIFPEKPIVNQDGKTLYRYKTWYCKGLENNWYMAGADRVADDGWKYIFSMSLSNKNSGKKIPDSVIFDLHRRSYEWYLKNESCNVLEN